MIEEDTDKADISKNRQEEIEEIEVTIAELKAEIKRTRHSQRLALYAAFVIVMLIAGGIYLSIVNSNAIFNSPPASTTSDIPSGAMTLFILFCVLGFFLLSGSFAAIGSAFTDQTIITTLKSQIDVWQTKKAIATQFAKVNEKPTYFESLVEINVLNLASYYELVKTHTDKSFRLTVRICLFGFFLIVSGLVIGFVDYSNALLISITATASGIITDLISGVFFYLYNRTVQQMKEYHNSLINVQNILLSFKLIEDTQDEHEKAKIVGETVAHLINNQNVSTKNTK
jgi:hypothetical protein